MTDLILIGGGGHARAVIDVIETQGKYRIKGIVDRAEKLNSIVLKYKVVASDEVIETLNDENTHFLVTIGQIKSAELRKELFNRVLAFGGTLTTVISPKSHISSYASIGQGTVVMHYALVNTGAQVGDNVIINSRALIEHDVKVGNHCHIATGAAVNGDVTIGDEVLIGSHTTIKQGVAIAKGTVVGAHAYVHQDITQPGVYVGVPAQRIDV